MATYHYKDCPLCTSGHFIGYLKVKDHSVSGEHFNIVKCTNCNFLFTNPIPDTKSITKYYKSDTYISHTNKANNLLNILYKMVRNFTIKKKVKLLKSFQGNSLLDVGCGTGLFLDAALKKGYRIKGIENDETAIQNQPQVIRNQCVTSISSLEINDSFDLITMWHVLEHVHNLPEQFLHLINHLKANGHIIIAVPNPDSWDKCHYQENWAGWDVPRHLYHFKQNDIKKLFYDNNITLIKTYPMKWDSFYVSMLSEKYNGRNLFNQLLLGTISGIISNFRAKNNNYSSIIYIGRKNED